MKKLRIGFIGQGWIGKNYADDFENRGHTIVRYGLEAPYNKNKAKIAACDIVFVAVPTPTTPQGYDDSILRAVLPLVGPKKVVVIKSTLPVGRTRLLQKAFPGIYIIHSPEFLSEATAAQDAAQPARNIIGLPNQNPTYKKLAKVVMGVLPPAPYSLICSSDEAELIKYAHNINGYVQVVQSNILFDISTAFKMKWDVLKDAFKADPFMSHRYLSPVDKRGRGAGGHCFIKDFEAFIEMVRASIPDPLALSVLEAIRNKNVALLLDSGKDLDLLEGVYGKAIIARPKK
jgi:UDPglucose 6-dehydrogenase